MFPSSHVIEAVFRRFDFARVLFRDIAQRRDVGMAIECVVVKVKLGIEREHVARGRDDQGIAPRSSSSRTRQMCDRVLQQS